MSFGSLQILLILAIGFAVAGLCASGYELVTERPPSFTLLARAGGLTALIVVPFLAFTAPFIIMRNTIRGRRIEQRRMEFVTLATIIAGSWSLGSGTLVIATLQACGLIGV